MLLTASYIREVGDFETGSLPIYEPHPVGAYLYLGIGCEFAIRLGSPQPGNYSRS